MDEIVLKSKISREVYDQLISCLAEQNLQDLTSGHGIYIEFSSTLKTQVQSYLGDLAAELTSATAT